MTYIKLPEKYIGEYADKVINTSYEVSTSKLFESNNLVYKNYNDSVNKLSVFINTTFDVLKTYYARVRITTKDGISKWSDIIVFKPNEINEIAINDILPSNVSIPIISFDYKPNNFPLTMFKIKTGPFSTIGDSSLVSVSYFIKDIVKDELVWESLYNKVYKSEIEINNIMLEKNKSYRISAIFNTNSNDSSQVGNITVVTGSNDNVKLTTMLTMLKADKDLGLNIIPNGKIESLTYELYIKNNMDNNLIWKTVTKKSEGNLSTTIPAAILKNKNNYILRIKDSLSGLYAYYPFNTF